MGYGRLVGATASSLSIPPLPPDYAQLPVSSPALTLDGSVEKKHESQRHALLRAAWRDLRAMRWLWTISWTIVSLCALALFLVLVFFSTIDSNPIPATFGALLGQGSVVAELACHPDGAFSPYKNTYRWWSLDGFFQVTLAFGQLTFTQVKLIDIAWGIFAGRLGQAIAGYLSWKVFADYLTTSMATTPATYTTFWLLFLHREPTITGWFRLLREFCRGHVLQSKAASAFVTFSVLFVVSLPTLTSSMAAYTPSITPFIRLDDSALIPFGDIKETLYVIHDGSRIGLQDNFAVPLSNFSSALFSMPARDIERQGTFMLPDGSDWQCFPCNKYLEYDCFRTNVSAYVSLYGFYGLDDRSSKFLDYELDPPTLNISAFFLQPPADKTVDPSLTSGRRFDYPEDDCYGFEWTDPSGHTPFRDVRNRRFQDLQGRTYSLAEIEARGTCQPFVVNSCSGADALFDRSCSVQLFQWGFSFLQAFINVLLTLLWGVGLYIIWLKSRIQLPLRGSREVPRGWRALIHLAETMRTDLDRHGIDPANMTDRELKTWIHKNTNGGAVTFQNSDDGLPPLENPGLGLLAAFRQWLRRGENKWWFSAYGVITTVAISVGLGLWGRYTLLRMSLLGLSNGLFWAITVGRSGVSKTMLVTFWFLMGVILASSPYGTEFERLCLAGSTGTSLFPIVDICS